jgi:hypothetical protein
MVQMLKLKYEENRSAADAQIQTGLQEVEMNTNRLISLLIVIGLAAVAALTVREAVATSLVTQWARETQGIQRGHAAEAARWAAQAEYYAKIARQAKEAEGIQRGHEAEAARWNAQAEYYARLAPPGSDSQSHLNLLNLIGAARYTGVALQEFERTGNRNALPVCITAETLAELPETIGGNRWKEFVPVCGQ